MSMRIYAITLVAVLVMLLTATINAHRRLKPRCPRCGERKGQQTISQREISNRNVMFGESDWFNMKRGEERLKVRRHTVLTGTLKCSKCGEQYETNWAEDRSVL